MYYKHNQYYSSVGISIILGISIRISISVSTSVLL